MDALIEVSALHKRFGALHAVRDLGFQVTRGEVLGFLGPNGAGKSTTMKMITGFLEPSAGAVSVCGIDVLAEPLAAKARLGYLPEGAPLYGEMSAGAFLEFIADVRGLAGAERKRLLEAAIERVHLEAVLAQRVETLSKGFKRRLGLAQAIMHDPEVLVLDEPTDGLDPNQKHEVRSLIAEMAAEKAIIISTHILEEVDAVCSRALIINDGTLVFAGTPAELEARSARHNAVQLRVRAGAAALEQALRDAPGVAAVEARAAADGRASARVIPERGHSIAAAVSEVLGREGWAIEELRVETGRLDEVFRAITQRAGDAGETVRS